MGKSTLKWWGGGAVVVGSQWFCGAGINQGWSCFPRSDLPTLAVILASLCSGFPAEKPLRTNSHSIAEQKSHLDLI